MLAEFREFINRGSFVDLAVGFVMGVAVTGVVTALVERLIMPAVGLVFGQPDFDRIGTFGGLDAEGVPIGSVGAVLTALVNLLLIAVVMFLIVKGYNAMQRQREAAEEAEEADEAVDEDAGPEEVVLLRAILAELREPSTPGRGHAGPQDPDAG